MDDKEQKTQVAQASGNGIMIKGEQRPMGPLLGIIIIIIILILGAFYFWGRWLSIQNDEEKENLPPLNSSEPAEIKASTTNDYPL